MSIIEDDNWWMKMLNYWPMNIHAYYFFLLALLIVFYPFHSFENWLIYWLFVQSCSISITCLILFHFFDRDFLYLSGHNCFYLLTRRATMAGGLIVIGFLGSFSCLPFPLFSSNLRFIRVSLWLLRTSIDNSRHTRITWRIWKRDWAADRFTWTRSIRVQVKEVAFMYGGKSYRDKIACLRVLSFCS